LKATSGTCQQRLAKWAALPRADPGFAVELSSRRGYDTLQRSHWRTALGDRVRAGRGAPVDRRPGGAKVPLPPRAGGGAPRFAAHGERRRLGTRSVRAWGQPCLRVTSRRRASFFDSMMERRSRSRCTTTPMASRQRWQNSWGRTGCGSSAQRHRARPPPRRPRDARAAQPRRHKSTKSERSLN
jgi:hypothetical protein